MFRTRICKLALLMRTGRRMSIALPAALGFVLALSGRPPLAQVDGAGPGSSVSDAPIVRKIEIEGTSGDDLKKAMRTIQTREGEPLNPSTQREDIRRLYDLGLFKPNINVKADPLADGIRLVYQVEPNPKVGAINISGNSVVNTKTLLKELPVKVGGVYTIQAQNKIRDNISRYYDEKGFNQAIVRVDERLGADNTVNLEITVDEGTKMKIKDLIIHGNENISNLNMKIRVQNKGSWGPFTHYFNESKFQQDIEMIKSLYISKGFLDVDVKRGDFVYAPDQSWVSPVIEVQEGPRYRVGRVEARGYSIFSREEVTEPFRALQGDYYNAAKFNSGAEKVKNMYGDEGFLACKVDPDFHKDPARGMVDVDVAINEGPRIYVGDVKVLSQTYPDDTQMSWLRRYYSRFSPPVKDEVVQREVRLHPGQVYRRFDEVRTKERLKSLNVFEDVKVHDQLSADPNVRDCIVDVTQGNTGNLLFGVGFGDVEGGFVYASYIEHNLFGMARDLRVSGLLGSKSSNFEVSYLDRYFRGTDTAAQFTAFYRHYRMTGGFDENNTGLTAEFSKPLSECVKQAIRLRLEYVSFDISDLDPQPAEQFNDYLAATIRYRLVQDTRDDTFLPTSGRILAGSIETGEADGFLLKFEGQYAKYVALNDKWVYAMNNEIGLLPYDSDNIGYADRFFLGGSKDMRGFKLNGAGPHDSQNHDVPIGGATKILSQHELRYSFTDNLAGVLFADVGTLDDKALSIGSPRASLGTGVRLRMPIAQVALDLAVPVVWDPLESTCRHASLSIL